MEDSREKQGTAMEIQVNRCSRDRKPKDNYDPVPDLETVTM